MNRDSRGPDHPCLSVSICLWFQYRIRYHRFKRGSNASRKPSPNMLNARVVKKMASPGKTTIQGFTSMNTRFAFKSHPQLGVGGWVPNPKKLSDDSIRIEVAIDRVLVTMRGAIQFGRICRNNSRH